VVGGGNARGSRKSEKKGEKPPRIAKGSRSFLYERGRPFRKKVKRGKEGP